MERLTQFDEFGNADIVGVDSDDLQLNLDFEQFNKVTNALNQLAYYENLAEVFEEKLQPEVFEFLKDKDELSKWLDRMLYAVRKLDEYARAEEQGMLLRLPCRVGDAIYRVFYYSQDRFCIKEMKFTLTLYEGYKNDFGKYIFLTLTEAEVKLEELRGGNNGNED